MHINHIVSPAPKGKGPGVPTDLSHTVATSARRARKPQPALASVEPDTVHVPERPHVIYPLSIYHASGTVKRVRYEQRAANAEPPTTFCTST